MLKDKIEGIRLSAGTNLYDFFVVPTIRITKDSSCYTFLTIEWLRWFVGLTW